MATTDKDKAAQAKKRKQRTKEADEQQSIAVAEQDRARADREAAAQALINEPATVKPDPEGDIDARMAALLKDHQRMGARPK